MPLHSFKGDIAQWEQDMQNLLFWPLQRVLGPGLPSLKCRCSFMGLQREHMINYSNLDIKYICSSYFSGALSVPYGVNDSFTLNTTLWQKVSLCFLVTRCLVVITNLQGHLKQLLPFGSSNLHNNDNNVWNLKYFYCLVLWNIEICDRSSVAKYYCYGHKELWMINVK